MYINNLQMCWESCYISLSFSFLPLTSSLCWVWNEFAGTKLVNCTKVQNWRWWGRETSKPPMLAIWKCFEHEFMKSCIFFTAIPTTSGKFCRLGSLVAASLIVPISRCVTAVTNAQLLGVVLYFYSLLRGCFSQNSQIEDISGQNYFSQITFSRLCGSKVRTG